MEQDLIIWLTQWHWWLVVAEIQTILAQYFTDPDEGAEFWALWIAMGYFVVFWSLDWAPFSMNIAEELFPIAHLRNKASKALSQHCKTPMAYWNIDTCSNFAVKFNLLRRKFRTVRQRGAELSKQDTSLWVAQNLSALISQLILPPRWNFVIIYCESICILVVC